MRKTNICICLFLAGLLSAPFTGCTELFFVAGPGGVFPPQTTTSSVISTGGLTTTQGTTVGGGTIAAPLYTQNIVDPVLEATAGAKVIKAADMDGDGLLDLVSGSNENQPIQLHMREATGLTFNTLSISGGGPIASMIDLEVVDLDGDGNLDIAVLVRDTGFVPVEDASIRGAVVLLFAPDDPTDQLAWTEVTITATFNLPGEDIGFAAFAVADFTNDGRADIMLGSNEIEETDVIRLYQNPGGSNARDSGAWTEAGLPVTLDVNLIQDLAAGDMDGDGDLDVVATFPTAKTFNVRWLVNPVQEAGIDAAMAGNWERRIVGQQSEVDPDNQGGDFIAVGDIDEDGNLDVAVAHGTLKLVQWFENPGAGFIEQQTFPWSVFNMAQLVDGVEMTQIQLVDMDLDGSLDLFATASGQMVGFERGSELRDFWNGYTILATNPIADIGVCDFADINADGLLDILAPFDREGLVQDQFLLFLRSTP